MNKLIISALLMVGLVGMIGTAAANPATVDIDSSTAYGSPNFIYNPLDNTVTSTDVTVYNIATYGDRYIAVATSDPDLYVRVFGVGGDGVSFDTGFTNNTQVGAQWVANDTVATQYFFTIEVKGTQNGNVIVSDNAGTDYVEDLVARAAADAGDSSGLVDIPEFPTIALPIAAILGLMFIISSRKKEE